MQDGLFCVDCTLLTVPSILYYISILHSTDAGRPLRCARARSADRDDPSGDGPGRGVVVPARRLPGVVGIIGIVGIVVGTVGGGGVVYTSVGHTTLGVQYLPQYTQVGHTD